VAQRLQLTIQALEARLHRARKHLRHILNGPLREEAQELGLALDAEELAGWRETRLWCQSCGQRHFFGTFERLSEGNIDFRLRCPGCQYHVNSWGHVPLEGLSSFRPAYKRVMQVISAYFLSGLASGWVTCTKCGAAQPLRITGPEKLAAFQEPEEESSRQAGLYVVTACQACGRHHADSAVSPLLWPHPAVQQFLATYPRAIAEPEMLCAYHGQPAIRVRWTAIASATRLTLFAHPQTLRVLMTMRD
jgi:hypothetical protein